MSYGYGVKCWGDKIDWAFGINMYTLLYLKQTTNKELLYTNK